MFHVTKSTIPRRWKDARSTKSGHHETNKAIDAFTCHPSSLERRTRSSHRSLLNPWNKSVRMSLRLTNFVEESGWTPEMDELARRPKRVPHFAAMQMILTEMQNHAAAWPFVQPVNKEEVPDYYTVVQEPMDLSTMEQKLDSDQYTTPDEFVRNAKLIFNNCRAYNGETTTYYKVFPYVDKFC